MPTRTLYLLFVLSGCTSLIDEVVFHKLLGYVFGSTTLATTTVLVAFMGGLALGGRVIGERADRAPRPIALYAWLECAIGGYVLLVPGLLSLCSALYARLGVSSAAGAPWHMIVRFVLSALILLVPTLLMGGTLPLLASAMLRVRPGAQAIVSRLYAFNTLGAAAGTLLASYALLPYAGIYGTLVLGAGTNLLITWRALRLQRAGAEDEATASSPALVHGSRADYQFALPIAFATGVVSFTLEVVWTHLLATIVGMSVYAFGLMLSMFLLGIALGSALVARVPRLRTRSLPWVQLSLAAIVLGTLPLWDRVPYVFARAGELHPGFAGMELTRAAVCAAMLLPPCTLLGITFPILLGSAGFERERVGERVGRLYAFNTLGCIAGAVLTGFVLIDRLGSRNVLWACALASALIGVAYAARVDERRLQRTAAALGAAAVLTFVGTQLPPWDWKALAAGMNVSFNRGGMIYDVLWAKEDAQGGVTTITRERRGITLRTNGKFQADDHTELVAQQGFALIPVLFTPDYGSALNIGYGSGITAGVLSRFPFRSIEIAELSPAIVTAADRYYPQLNFRPTRDPRVRLVYNDGRNHLLVSRQAYDLITVEITSIWFAGAASLYSLEFYESCKRHLTQHGVMQQWIQLHHISRRDLLVIINTLRRVFPYVSLWRQGTQGALIASVQPQRISYLHVQAMNELPAAQPVRARMPVPNFFALLAAQQLGPEDVDALLGELPDYVPEALVPYAISTDYYPLLEYSTPRGYALPDSVEVENIRWLRRHQRQLLPALDGVPDAATQRALERFARP